MRRIDAIYKDGKFEPVGAVQLVEGKRVSVEYSADDTPAEAQGGAMSQINAIRGLFTAEEAVEFNRVVDEAFEDEEAEPGALARLGALVGSMTDEEARAVDDIIEENFRRVG